MATKSAPTVDGFLKALKHKRKAEIEVLRAAILSADKGITERVKWNAPSFCIAGDDRVTFRLTPGDRIELIFHRGAKKRSDTAKFKFKDPTGWVRWLDPDRGVISLVDAADVKSKRKGLVSLVKAWMRATADVVP